MIYIGLLKESLNGDSNQFLLYQQHEQLPTSNF